MSHRTQVTLSDAQYRRLRNESERAGVSLAELVRRAVDRSLGSTSQDERLKALDDSFSTWPEMPDGATYTESLRRGTARRLGAV